MKNGPTGVCVIDHDQDTIQKIVGSALCSRVLQKKHEMNVPLKIPRRETVTNRGHMIQGDLEVQSEIIPEGYQPTGEEVLQYALFIGMNEQEDRDLFWIAREGLKSPMPPHWTAIKDANGATYYMNMATTKVIHEHPLDERVRDKFHEEKIKLQKLR